jgi:hypothetical protein
MTKGSNSSEQASAKMYWNGDGSAVTLLGWLFVLAHSYDGNRDELSRFVVP